MNKFMITIIVLMNIIRHDNDDDNYDGDGGGDGEVI